MSLYSHGYILMHPASSDRTTCKEVGHLFPWFVRLNYNPIKTLLNMGPGKAVPVSEF